MDTHSTTPPADADVDVIVGWMRAWPCVTPAQRAQLRAAAAALTLLDHGPLRLVEPLPPAVRVTRAAQVLRVSRTTIHAMLRDGRLDGYRISSNPRAEWRVTESSVRALLHPARTPQTPRPSATSSQEPRSPLGRGPLHTVTRGGAA